MLQKLPVSKVLSSTTENKATMEQDLTRVKDICSRQALKSLPFIQLSSLRLLYKAVLEDQVQDFVIWDLVASIARQTALLQKSNDTKHAKALLEKEIGHVHVGTPNFCDEFFGTVPGLTAAAAQVFKSCTMSSTPLFQQGWTSWPREDNPVEILDWLIKIVATLKAFAKDLGLKVHERPLLQPCEIVANLNNKPQLDFGFASSVESENSIFCNWPHILVLGEIATDSSDLWLNVGQLAKTVMSAHENRRFLLAFTLCGPTMTIWEFDRLGGIASEQFDINVQGEQFVLIMLGFLCMNSEQLGFDPTIKAFDSKHCIDIVRSGKQERFVLTETLIQYEGLAGRGLRCWAVCLQDDPNKRFFVKDDWRSPEDFYEEDFFQENKDSVIANVSQYYHHYIVRTNNMDDRVSRNVRKGLKVAEKNMASLPDKVHYRSIIQDMGRPIYEATSCTNFLAAIKDCIQGHRSLIKGGSDRVR